MEGASELAWNSPIQRTGPANVLSPQRVDALASRSLKGFSTSANNCSTKISINDSPPGMEHTQVDSAGQVSGENRADRRGKEHVQGIESPKDD